MLTDATRAPFLVDTWSETRPDSWGQLITAWSWRLIGRDGECREAGSGYGSRREAEDFAKAVAANEMA